MVDVCAEGEVFVCHVGEDECFDFAGGVLWRAAVEGGVVDWLLEAGDDADYLGLFGCAACPGNVLEAA